MIKKEYKFPKLHNYFEIKVRDAETGKIIQEARAENVVLDQFYHKAMSNNTSRYNGVRGLRIGSGAGTPAAADTNLFTAIASIAFPVAQTVNIAADLVTLQGSITLGESEYVGQTITEVGLLHGGTTSTISGASLISHAMLEDSEGNPISIGPKTNTQIIEIYATLYITRGTGMSALNDAKNTFVPWVTARTDATYGMWYKDPLRVFCPYYAKSNGASLTAGTYNTGSKTLPFSVTIATTDTMNTYSDKMLYPTTDILGFLMPNFATGFFFPNASAFPAFSFSERNIGTGDGTKRFFNFDNGYFIDGSEVIKVDGVTKTAGVDYETHQGARQILNFLKATYPYSAGLVPVLYSTAADKSSPTLVGNIDSETQFASTQYGLIDLQQLTRIGGLYPVKNYSYGYTLTMFYSTDNVNWTQFHTENKAYNTYFSPVKDLEEIEMRYIWFSCSSYGLLGLQLYGPPSIEFITAPANGLAITGSWNTGVPPKNANFFYDVEVAVVGSW